MTQIEEFERNLTKKVLEFNRLVISWKKGEKTKTDVTNAISALESEIKKIGTQSVRKSCLMHRIEKFKKQLEAEP